MSTTIQQGGFSTLRHLSGLGARAAVVGWVLAAGLAQAQGVQQPASAAAAAAQPVVDQGLIAPGVLLGLGGQVAQAIDGVRYRELWAGASPAVRALVSDVDFVKGVTQLRSKDAGAPSRRTWVRLDLQQQPNQPDKRSPGGLYASCIFEAQFGSALRREIVSFRLDEDRQWRFAGYHLQ